MVSQLVPRSRLSDHSDFSGRHCVISAGLAGTLEQEGRMIEAYRTAQQVFHTDFGGKVIS